MEVKDVTFGYGAGEPNLMENLSFTVARRDKICIVVPVLKGKDTLMFSAEEDCFEIVKATDMVCSH